VSESTIDRARLGAMAPVTQRLEVGEIVRSAARPCDDVVRVCCRAAAHGADRIEAQEGEAEALPGPAVSAPGGGGPVLVGTRGDVLECAVGHTEILPFGTSFILHER